MTESDFLRMTWPSRFTVNFHDGTSRVLGGGSNGVGFSSVEDDPSNRGFITAVDVPGHAGGRERGFICYIDEIRSIVAENGDVLWSARR